MGNSGSKESEEDELESELEDSDDQGPEGWPDVYPQREVQCGHPRFSIAPKRKPLTTSSNDYNYDDLVNGQIRVFDILRRDPADPGDVIHINIRKVWIPDLHSRE